MIYFVIADQAARSVIQVGTEVALEVLLVAEVAALAFDS